MGVERDREPRHPHARRAGGRDHAVERAVHALDLEDRARARRRLHGDPQARRVVAALVLAARRPDRARPASRPASSTSSRGSGRRSARRSSRIPDVAADLVHGLAGDRRARSARRRRGTSSRSPPSSAARGRCSCSPTATSKRRARKAAGQYDDAGQVCLAGTRLLVEDAVAERFLELFDRYTDEHVLGDPREDATTVSPLIHPEHLLRVEEFVERARADGDEIVRGGERSDLGGLWYEPTLVVPRSNDSEIVQREVFGPVLTLQTFTDEDEAVELANSTAYGLSAIVYTGSAERAERVGRDVRAGTVWVNTFLVRDLTAPFGGIGISGIGREGGDYALDFYSDLKTLQILDGSTAQ